MQTVREANVILQYEQVNALNDYVSRSAVFFSALSAEECALVRSAAEALSRVQVLVQPYAVTPVRKARTKLYPLNSSGEWLSERVEKFIKLAAAKLDVEISGELECPLFVSYSGGEYFDWHTDIASGTESRRKISVSIQLSPSDAYEGGSLQTNHASFEREARSQGALIAFPSHLPHRVLPVTRGERCVLVLWAHGPPFR